MLNTNFVTKSDSSGGISPAVNQKQPIRLTWLYDSAEFGGVSCSILGCRWLGRFAAAAAEEVVASI
ncbi:hypothetical protein DERP_014156 [Dermatophagoides pteronyssinus]|uniref:Uncharacterized protein n=1 Tax=Dermatophagoides pteronyssinus TaxID=6956 RepID=A0ABQ8IWG7_DERPT|nr:hypothetical protein DERP_014156 [Dermatophagoides pteronyssinus]